MTEYSITIRPHKKTFIEIEKKKVNFFPLFLKDTITHIISYEKGKDDTYNHFQCYIEYNKEKRQDKIRDKILRDLYKLGIELDPDTSNRKLLNMNLSKYLKEIDYNSDTATSYHTNKLRIFVYTDNPTTTNITGLFQSRLVYKDS